MQKLFKYPGSIKDYFESGKNIVVSKPKSCPFCNNSGNSCLIGWGFYKGNGKSCIDWEPPIGSIFYIKRFYCKETFRTISMHPEFIHPGKRYSHEFVGAVLEEVLETGKSVSAAGRDFSVHYQTILTWLYRFTLWREVKAICFSGYGNLDGFIKSSVWDYARSFWKLLRKAFTGGPGDVLTAATMKIWEAYGSPLY